MASGFTTIHIYALSVYHHLSCEFESRSIKTEDVKKLLKNLDPSKATGSDEILAHDVY